MNRMMDLQQIRKDGQGNRLPTWHVETVWYIGNWQQIYLLGGYYPIRYGWVCLNDVIYLVSQLRGPKSAWCIMTDKATWRHSLITSAGHELDGPANDRDILTSKGA